MTTQQSLTDFAQQIRLHTMKMLVHLGFGHFGGSLSIVETLAVLYGAVMRVDPQNPAWEERDYLVLSKGHAGPALYATLALKGYFALAELLTLNRDGTCLPSHPDRLLTKGIDATTGSLGQGLSIATGIALAHKLAKRPNRVFAIVGDGELNEGQCWEALQFIAHHRLQNLTVLVDYNRYQLDGTLDEIIKPFSLVEKFRAFGCASVEVQGDDLAAIHTLLQEPRTEEQQPLVVVLNTKKGQGVACIEKLKNSHHLRLTAESRVEMEQAIAAMERGMQ